MSVEWDRIQEYCEKVESIMCELITEAGDLEANNDTLLAVEEEMKEKISELEDVIVNLKEERGV